MKDFDFKIFVKRTDRKKTASIKIDEGSVKVIVPKSVSSNRIREFISKREGWIKAKLNQQTSIKSKKTIKYVDGEEVPYLGRHYRLKFITGDLLSVKMKNGSFVITIPEVQKSKPKVIKNLLENWYKKHAKIHLEEKTKKFSETMGVNPKSIMIKNYKSRWGSCSSVGELSFNWRIILTPHRIVDYVVVHELCHLLEHNHSPKYRSHVKRYIPNWKDCRNWLKENNVLSL